VAIERDFRSVNIETVVMQLGNDSVGLNLRMRGKKNYPKYSQTEK